MNRRTAKLVAACCLGLVGVIASSLHAFAAEDRAVPPSAEQMAEVLAGVNTLTAGFVQERHLSLFNQPLRTEGHLYSAKPNKIRWEITQPYASILVSDGSGVAQFESVNGQWQRLNLGVEDALRQVVRQIAMIVAGEFANSTADYEVTSPEATDRPMLRLTPKRAAMRKVMAGIDIEFAADLKSLERVTLREVDGDRTEIRFLDQRVDVVFPDRTFDLRQPLPREQISAAGPETTEK